MKRIALSFIACLLIVSLSLGVVSAVDFPSEADTTIVQAGYSGTIPGLWDGAFVGKDYYNIGPDGTNYGLVTGSVRALYRFNLSSIPSNAVINSAKFVTGATALSSYSLPVETHRIIADWGESYTTWDNFNYGNNVDYSVVSTTYVQYVPQGGGINYVARLVEWDVTSLVRQWVNGTYPNYGLALINNMSSYGASLSTKEEVANQSMKPRLVVDYTVPQTVQPAPVPAPAPAPAPAPVKKKKVTTNYHKYLCKKMPGWHKKHCGKGKNKKQTKKNKKLHNKKCSKIIIIK